MDRDGDVWEYVPAEHKSKHHAKVRRVLIGPRRQAVLEKYIDNRPAEAYCFSPAEVEADRVATLRSNRKSKVQPSQVDRRRPDPARVKQDHYTVAAYRRAIYRACERAFGMPLILKHPNRRPAAQRDHAKLLARRWRKRHCWKPHQLRHTAATSIRRVAGVDAVATILGHSSAALTDQVYAERNMDAARTVVKEVG